jgi:hypothetical protein
MKKHTVGFGALIGLVIGIIAIVLGVYLPGDSPLVVALLAVESPLVHVMNWFGKALHSWGGFTAVYILSVLIYWTLVGLAVGFIVRWLINRKTRHAA